MLASKCIIILVLKHYYKGDNQSSSLTPDRMPAMSDFSIFYNSPGITDTWYL